MRARCCDLYSLKKIAKLVCCRTCFPPEADSTYIYTIQYNTHSCVIHSAGPGCTLPASRENGEIEWQGDRLSATLICKENYLVAGNTQAFCDGLSWDRLLGNCRHRNHTLISHACDFETDDLCGWTNGVTSVAQWQRGATSSRLTMSNTGPRHDHTLESSYGGHYMIIESGRAMAGAHHFVSPIYARALSLKTKCCFTFHYFMYGRAVGTLTVSVKPHDMHVDEMWEKHAST